MGREDRAGSGVVGSGLGETLVQELRHTVRAEVMLPVQVQVTVGPGT
jgi:hypothetical protein